MNDLNGLANNLAVAIRSVVGSGNIALHEPKFSGNEWAYLKECLDTNFVSSVGPFVNQFESDLAAYTGSKYAVAVVNGTAALHIALKLSGVVPGDEVLMPALTFVATANAVTYCGAEPHFVDSEKVSLGIDPAALRDYLKSVASVDSGLCVNRLTGHVIRAIIVMHTFGHPSQLDELLKLADEYQLKLIEDAAESIGSFYKGQHTGTFGDFGVLSFNGNKTITTGGGGAILTQSKEAAAYAKHLTTTAKLSHRWEYSHDEIAYNYRMPNLNAALGCAQLEQLPEQLLHKRRLFFLYQEALKKVVGAHLFSEPVDCKSNYWLQTIMLSGGGLEYRDSLLSVTNDDGIMTRPVWALLNKLPMYKHCQAMDLSCATFLEESLINLPSSSFLGAR